MKTIILRLHLAILIVFSLVAAAPAVKVTTHGPKFENLRSNDGSISGRCTTTEILGEFDCFIARTTLSQPKKVTNRDALIGFFADQFQAKTPSEWRNSENCKVIHKKTFEEWLEFDDQKRQHANTIVKFALKESFNRTKEFCRFPTDGKFYDLIELSAQMQENLCLIKTETVITKVNWNQESKSYISPDLLSNKRCQSLIYTIKREEDWSYSLIRDFKSNTMEGCARQSSKVSLIEYRAKEKAVSRSCNAIFN